MSNLYVRIDDRLIHGQIVTAWAQSLGIERIIGMDDALSQNKMMQQIVKMSVPKHIESHIVSTEDAKELLKDSSKKTLLITRFCRNLGLVEEDIKTAEHVIIGNCSKQQDAVFTHKGIGVGGLVSLTKEDVDVLDTLDNNDIEVIYQLLPNEKRVSWKQFKEE